MVEIIHVISENVVLAILSQDEEMQASGKSLLQISELLNARRMANQHSIVPICTLQSTLESFVDRGIMIKGFVAAPGSDLYHLTQKGREVVKNCPLCGNKQCLFKRS